MNKRILLICTETNTVINFRLELIKYLIDNNFEVSVIASDNKRIRDIYKTGVKKVFVIPFANRSVNPFSFFKVKSKIKETILQYRPNIVFTFQAKPNILGARVASQCKIEKVYSMVEGLGDPFQPSSLLGICFRFIYCKMYKKSLKN